MPKFRPSLGDVAVLDVGSDKHVALVEMSRPTGSANRVKRAIAVRKLQRDYGTRYVQMLLEYNSRRKSAGR